MCRSLISAASGSRVLESLPPFHNPSPNAISKADADIFADLTPIGTKRETERLAETEHWKAEAGCWKAEAGCWK